MGRARLIVSRVHVRLTLTAVTNGNSSSDAWFLAAAQSAGHRRASLADIIGQGDYINHAIFTVKEIEHAVRRLVPGGLLGVEAPDAFRVTSAGQALVRQATRGLRVWPPVIDRLTTAIDAALPSQSAGLVAGWTLDAGLYERACVRYHEDVRSFERLPGLVRAVVISFWVLVIKVWQVLRR